MEALYLILLQAISPTGGISADWVLVGITGIAFLLFWRMLWKIEKGLEKVVGSVAEHETEIEVMKTEIVQLKRKR
jgi:hypothetical protein